MNFLHFRFRDELGLVQFGWNYQNFIKIMKTFHLNFLSFHLKFEKVTFSSGIRIRMNFKRKLQILTNFKDFPLYFVKWKWKFTNFKWKSSYLIFFELKFENLKQIQLERQTFVFFEFQLKYCKISVEIQIFHLKIIVKNII